MTLGVLAPVGACAMFAILPPQLAIPDPGVFPPEAMPYGRSHAEWSAAWWQWFMEHPLAGHPGLDDPQFDVTSGQSGRVWFLAGILDSSAHTRNVTIPKGTALFVALLNAEMSDLEGAATEAEQRAIAKFLADHVGDLSCTLDGVAVDDLADYRFESEQFSFTAPDPWIFSPAPSGPGNAVADGYYVFVRPMGVGQHTLHYSGGFFFAAGELGPEPVELTLDMTYNITVIS